jgi:hypothetical protein
MFFFRSKVFQHEMKIKLIFGIHFYKEECMPFFVDITLRQ